MLFFKFHKNYLSDSINEEIKAFYSYSDFVNFIKNILKNESDVIKLSTYSNLIDNETKWKYRISVSKLDYKDKCFKIIGFLYDDSCKSCFRFFNHHYLDCYVEAYTTSSKTEDYFYHIIY